MKAIDQGAEFQRQQGINGLLDRLFGYLKQAGLYQAEAIKFERGKAITDLALLEAQLRFYGALTSQTQEWLDAARKFVLSEDFGRDNNGGGSGDIQNVRIVEAGIEWDSIVDKIKSLVDSWREAVKQFADSTAQLMTDEGLTNLTQDQQLAFAKSQVEDLAAKAAGGDIEALTKLEEARAEYLRELRESEGGGFGFDKGWDWVMGLTADVLENAQSAEDSLITKELEKNIQAWAYVMDKLASQLEAAFYSNTQDLIDAIYNAIGGVPSFASGGVVMRGPRLVRVAEYIPEAIVPLDKLAGMIPYKPIPYKPMSMPIDNKAGNGKVYGPNNGYIGDRDSLARLSALEISNDKISKTLITMAGDISTMARRR